MRTTTTSRLAVFCFVPLLIVATACSSDPSSGDASSSADAQNASAAEDAIPGLVHVESAHDVPTTVQRLTDVLKKKGVTVFNTIDHAEGAEGVDMELRPTTLVIFGNPKVGTPLMQCNQTVGLDLPMKMLAWKDADGTVRLSYADPAVLAQRHDLGSACEGPVNKASTALGNFASAAASGS